MYLSLFNVKCHCNTITLYVYLIYEVMLKVNLMGMCWRLFGSFTVD
jgi:hypothetical protein